MIQSTTLLQLQAFQTCLFLSVCEMVSNGPTGWPHGHGLQPTARAMAKILAYRILALMILAEKILAEQITGGRPAEEGEGERCRSWG